MANILIADDSVVIRKTLRRLLTKGGHDVISEASNGGEAFNEYKLHQPDIVTLDITMPLVDGIAALKQIIENFPDARIIMISAIEQKKLVFEALENGAKHYIIKPFDEKVVLEIIKLVMEE